MKGEVGERKLLRLPLPVPVHYTVSSMNSLVGWGWVSFLCFPLFWPNCVSISNFFCLYGSWFWLLQSHPHGLP